MFTHSNSCVISLPIGPVDTPETLLLPPSAPEYKIKICRNNTVMQGRVLFKHKRLLKYWTYLQSTTL